MIGAIIGDIAGSIYEFNNTFDYNFPLFSERGSFTDDTICTIAIADALVKGTGYQESLLSWCRKFPSPMGGYGGSFARWLKSTNPEPYKSFGNGSAMRVSPVAWAFDKYDKMGEEAIKTALPTHNHPEGQKGALAVASAIWTGRFTKDKKEIEKIGNNYYPGFMEKDYPKGRFDETCMGSVPLSFKILLESISFEDAVRRAISYGGDSDTLGAIVGSMAEAMFGIPKELSDRALAYLPKEITDVIDSFKQKFNYNV